jgi:ribosomal protein S18 acetylase RimI-like enzyme
VNGIDALVDICSAAPDDAAAIAAISTGHIAEKMPFIVESLARRSVMTARAGGRVVGYVVWDRAFFGRPFVWLLGVDPAFRRQGIATRLLAQFEQHWRGESVFTSTNATNRTMRALLDGLGYRPSGRIDNIDPGDPEMIYCKEIAP